MSELTAEYVESLLKLALIEQKKSILLKMGEPGTTTETVISYIRQYEAMDSAIRDAKRLRSSAEAIVKASRT